MSEVNNTLDPLFCFPILKTTLRHCYVASTIFFLYVKQEENWVVFYVTSTMDSLEYSDSKSKRIREQVIPKFWVKKKIFQKQCPR